MVMDWSRTAKVSKFRLYSDELGTFVTARWYRAMPDAKLFPDWHRFGNSDWFPDDTEMAVGDYNQSPRHFDQGVPPGFVHGNAYCGPLRYFQEGVKRSENPTPLPRDPITGLAQCCKGSPEPGAWHEAERLVTPFGFAVNWNEASRPASGAGTMPAWNEAEQQASGAGADATWQEAETQASGAGMETDWQEAESLEAPSVPAAALGTSCSNISAPVFTTYYVTVSGTADLSCDCSPVDGVWPVAQIAACTWRSGNVDFCGGTRRYRWQVTIQSGGTVRVSFVRNGGGGTAIAAIWDSSTVWDGFSPITCDLVSANTDCDWPLTVSVSV
jgi:hypothetical protein